MRDFGLPAGVLAFVALILHVSMPGAPENTPAPVPKPGSAETSKKHKNPPEKGNQETPEIEGPWLASRYFFGRMPPEVHLEDLPPDEHGKATGSSNGPNCLPCEALGNCFDYSNRAKCAPSLADLFAIKDPSKVEFLIATVPDPLHTRLALFTDSSIDAIERGLDVTGWQIATEWLPWNDSADPDEKDPEKRMKERALIRNVEGRPGLIVFKHKIVTPGQFDDRVLFVFIVGETPIAGVNKREFKFARQSMRAIREHAVPVERSGAAPGLPQSVVHEYVRILGPTFSGSFHSLFDLIAEDEQIDQKKPFEYIVRSGTATSSADARALISDGINFRGATENSTTQTKQLCDAISDMNVDPDNVAIISEDETDFGDIFSDAPMCTEIKLKVFRFPRDISHLRNAFREATGRSQDGKAPLPYLDFSLKNSDAGEDSVPTFSGAQTPLVQDAVVNQIAQAIRRDGVRVVEIAATNVLDVLFLARVLRRDCPNTRLLIPYADLLFVEAAQAGSLTGVLALSTYPMFAARNDWLPEQKDMPLFAPDSNSEGVSNAAILLSRRCDCSGKCGALADYQGWPASALQSCGPAVPRLDHPPEWLLTLDREGFLPVRVWTSESSQSTLKSKADDTSWFDDTPSNSEASLRLQRPPRIWEVLTAAIASASVLLCLWIAVLARWKDIHGSEGLAIVTCTGAETCRPVYTFLFLTGLTTLQGLLVLPYVWDDSNVPSRLWWLAFVGMLCPCVAASVVILRLLMCKALPWRSALMIAGFVLFGLILWTWSRLCHNNDAGHRSFFFAFRSLELRIGSSPLWPILASFAAILVFLHAQIVRLYLADTQDPEVLTELPGVPLESRLKQSCNSFTASLKSLIGLHEQRQRVACVISIVLLIVGCYLSRAGLRLSSVDGPQYVALSGSLQVLVLFIVLFACRRCTVLCHLFQEFLSTLNSFPFTRSFRQWDQSIGRQPLWVRQLSLQSPNIPIDSAVVLHDLSNSTLITECRDEQHEIRHFYLSYRNSLASFLAVQNDADRASVMCRHLSLRKLNTTIAAYVFNEVLLKKWRSEALFGSREADQTGSAVQGGSSASGAPPIPRTFGDLAETFVALHYSAFLLYGVKQIRNALMFIPVGYILLVVSLTSYPLQSPRLIGDVLLVLLAIVVFVLWRCLSTLERDPILSRIAGTDPGRLNKEFYFKLLGYLGFPALGLLASEFPAVSNFLFSWVQPTLEAFK